MGKPTETTDAAEAPKKRKTVTVFAACHLSEDGCHYKPGDAMEVTEARADALGPCVTKSGPES